MSELFYHLNMTEEKSQNIDEMIAEITKQIDDLREELIETERTFNLKKEQFIKLQGALEAFEVVKTNNL